MRVGRVILVSFVWLLVVSGVHACGKPVAGGDSESHFLKSCGSSCGPGLECRCGVCTRSCSSKDDCSGTSRVAECAQPDTTSCSVAARTCDVLCASDAVCQTIGAGYTCVMGRCRKVDAATTSNTRTGKTESPTTDRTPGPDAATDPAPGPDATTNDTIGCPGLKTVPPRPAGNGLGGATEIVAVQSNVDFGDSKPAATPPTRYNGIGFDLDGVCTTSSNAASTCALSQDQQTIADGTNGIDNSFGYVIQQWRNFVPSNLSSEIYTMQLQNGASNLALRVTGYNEQPDDDDVQVALFITSNFNAFGGDTGPKWDGTDVFPVDSRSVVNDDLSQPRAVDPHAYVSGGKLVAMLGAFTQPLLFSLTTAVQVNLTLHLEGSFLVCTISPADVAASRYKLSCTLAGTWSADDFLHQIWRFPDPTDLQHPKPLCTTSPPYQTFKNVICLSTDVASSRSSGPTAPCDALSLGMNFDMSPALLGNVYGFQDSPAMCTAGTDPANDSCAM